MAILKTVIRLGVIGGLATGAAVVVAGPHRVAALAGQARSAVIGVIDRNIDDPIVLRSQLRELEGQYPAKIAEVSGALAELEAQLVQVEREKQLAERVVELAAADQQNLQTLLVDAEAARTESPYAMISVRFDNRSFSLEQAYTRATQINQTVAAYQGRAQSAQQTLELLGVERERLAELLGKLETERADFQAQLAVLDSRIDSLARKERMVDMVEERQRSLDNLDRFASVHSFDQVMANLNKAEAEVEARFKSLSSQEQTNDYESKAKAMLGAENAAKTVFEKTKTLVPAPEETIEITPQGKVGADQVAINKKIVIE